STLPRAKWAILWICTGFRRTVGRDGRPVGEHPEPERYCLAVRTRGGDPGANRSWLAGRRDRLPRFHRQPDWRGFLGEPYGLGHGTRSRNSRERKGHERP